MSLFPTAEFRATNVEMDSEEFRTILNWQFSDDYILRLLSHNIPQRVSFSDCQIWIYQNEQDQLVGFGTLDVCDEYWRFTSGRLHTYIPLLAVDRRFQGRGYGVAIVTHLATEAAAVARKLGCADALYLDVYEDNLPAINSTKNVDSSMSY